jgi:hypothetical protein
MRCQGLQLALMRNGKSRGYAEQILEGATIGLALGGLLSVYAILLLAIRGPGFFETRLDMPFWVVPILYLLGGVLAGASMGLFGSLARGFISHLVVGFLVALPPTLLVCFTVISAEDIPRLLLPCTVALAAFWGGVGGAITWYTR